MTMRAQSERLRLEYRESVARAKELFSSAGGERLRARPAGGGWCAAECVEHLALTGEDYVKRIRAAIESAKTRPAGGEEKLSLAGRVLMRMFEPPVRRRFTAAPHLVPAAAAPRLDLLLGRFEQAHVHLMRLVEETDALDRTRIRIALPDSDWVRLTLFDTFELIAAHDRRHLWQAERAARV